MPENGPLLRSLVHSTSSDSTSSEVCTRYFCRGNDICFPDEDLRVSVLPCFVAPISLPLLFAIADPSIPVNVVRVLLHVLGYDANGHYVFPSSENVAVDLLFPHPCHLAFFPLTPSNAPDLRISPPVLTPASVASNDEEEDYDSDVPPPLEPVLNPVHHLDPVARSRRRRT
ncbi:hypothetical protein K523DRAFT_420295 [Schizophyllum commune Tattone D]|nr:hypothetical protein K525DRAFT_264529 [Schizophyllum commune Loenen D]KAI5825091.1 hypothetical protein K523DRAFT_420295 [Schizophyllum commune Tattone D]